MSLSILSKDLDRLLSDLIDRLPVYGPVEEKNEIFSKYRFRKLKKAKDLKLNYGPTVIPPKNIFFRLNAIY